MTYQRHTLCYLKPKAKPLTRAPDELLFYWLKNRFPLIYTHQPQHLTTTQIKLAIPYFNPTTRQKIRKSYLFSPASISHYQALPELIRIFPNLIVPKKHSLRVYGSYCWQHITQLPYVQASSDLDVQLTYTNQSLAELTQLHQQLEKSLPVKLVDGEIRFANIGDCSWIELIQPSFCDTILFKSEHQLRLIPREELYEAFPALRA